MRNILTILFFIFSFYSDSLAQEYINIKDLSGRTLTVPKNPKRIILTSARQIYWLSMVKKNPFENVVGIDGSWWKYDNHFYNVLTKKFPNAKKIQNLGDGENTDFNAEYFIALNPDIVFMSAYNANTIKVKAIVDKLKKFNIPVVFVSATNNLHLSNIQSLRLMGKIFNREKHISELEDFILQNLNTVFYRINKNKTINRPKVILQFSPGYSNTCCYIAGRDGFGRLLTDAGADNWGDNTLQNGGVMNIEQIYVSNFDKVLVTGGAWSQAKPSKKFKFLELGYQANKQHLNKSFEYLNNRKYWKELESVKNGETYGLWHQYNSTPYAFLATIVMAKWFYPEKFIDFDTYKLMQEFHKKFMPFDMQGYLHIDQKELK